MDALRRAHAPQAPPRHSPLLCITRCLALALLPRAAWAVQAPSMPPFPPPPPSPPLPPFPPSSSLDDDDSFPPEEKNVSVMYYVYGGILGFFALCVLGYCLWKSSANLRKLSAELSEVVGRREFMEKQEERLTGKKAGGDGAKGRKKGAKGLDGAQKGKEAADQGTMLTAGLGGLAALA